MATIHVARISSFTVDSAGNRIDKSKGNNSITEMLYTSSAILVLPDPTIPNSLGYPSLSNYLASESSSGFEFKHMNQSFLITYRP